MLNKRTQTLGQRTDEHGKTLTHVDMLIYGDSGAGKTFRAATAPGPLYVISPDPTSHKAIPFPVDGLIVKEIDDIKETIMDFRRGGHGYATLIVDGVSFMHDMMLKEVGWYMHEQMGAKDPELMPIQGRLKIQSQFSSMMRALVDLSQVPDENERVNVIFTTLSERLKEDDRAPFTIRPLLGTQKMNEKFPAFFSIIAYIQSSNNTDDKGRPTMDREMLFTPMNGIMARDRQNIFLPFYDVAPDLSDYLKHKEVK